MKVKAPDEATAIGRADAYLKEKYGEVYTINAVTMVSEKNPMTQAKRIAFDIKHNVNNGGEIKVNCTSEKEALQLKADIYKQLSIYGIRHQYLVIHWCKAITVTSIY